MTALLAFLPLSIYSQPRARLIHLDMSNHVTGEGNGIPLQYSCLENPMDGGAWWAAVYGVTQSRTWLSDFPFTFHFHALEKEMATHSSVLAWRIPGMAEPGGLPSMGSHRVGHDWNDLAAAAITSLLPQNKLLIEDKSQGPYNSRISFCLSALSYCLYTIHFTSASLVSICSYKHMSLSLWQSYFRFPQSLLLSCVSQIFAQMFSS